MNTTGSIGFRTNGWARAKLLERAQAIMQLERYGQVSPQARGKSLTAKFARIEALPQALAPLAEGVPPTGQSLIRTDLQVALEQFGDVVYFSDVLQDTIEDNTIKDLMDLVGQQAAETKEMNRFSLLSAGASVYYGGTGTTRPTVNGPMNRPLLRKQYRSLKRNRSEFITQIVAPTAKIATEPVAAAYMCIGHDDLTADIEDCTNYKSVEKYSDPTKAMPGELGAVGQFRFCLGDLYKPYLAAATSITGSTYLVNGSAGVSGHPDVYPVLCFGKNSYGIVPLQGKDAVKIYFRNPEEVDSGNPIGQKGSCGWKMMDAALILNDAWFTRDEVAVTGTPTT